jgi:hypothetical protein
MGCFSLIGTGVVDEEHLGGLDAGFHFGRWILTGGLSLLRICKGVRGLAANHRILYYRTGKCKNMYHELSIHKRTFLRLGMFSKERIERIIGAYVVTDVQR